MGAGCTTFEFMLSLGFFVSKEKNTSARNAKPIYGQELKKELSSQIIKITEQKWFFTSHGGWNRVYKLFFNF